MSPNILTVGLGEIKIGADPQDVLVAFGLGSCLGIGMYDPTLKVAGLLHAILPTHTNGNSDQRSRFVDTGVQSLLAQLLQKGADPKRLIVRMAGGANLLVSPGSTASFNIGTRNVEAAYTALAALNLKIASQEVGGNIGRTVRLYVADGRMTIRTAGNQEREI